MFCAPAATAPELSRAPSPLVVANGFATMPFIMDGEIWVYVSYVLIALMIVICLIFIVKALEYGKKYSHMEMEATSFDDLEEATNSGH